MVKKNRDIFSHNDFALTRTNTPQRDIKIITENHVSQEMMFQWSRNTTPIESLYSLLETSNREPRQVDITKIIVCTSTQCMYRNE